MIYYFSGTGNSEYVARKIAERENDTTCFIPDVITGKAASSLDARTDILGFVLPTYYYGLPVIAKQFIDILAPLSVHGMYTFLVLTCGASTGDAVGMFRQLLEEHGCSLSAAFAVRMVDNYVPMFRIDSDDDIKNKLEAADSEIDDIADKIHHRENGDFNAFRGSLPRLLTRMSYPLYLNGRRTKPFFAENSCIGCGKCAKECPVNAIEMKADRPAWVIQRCVLCLRCLHTCPRGAIQYGRSTASKGRYTNPRLKATPHNSRLKP